MDDVKQGQDRQQPGKGHRNSAKCNFTAEEAPKALLSASGISYYHNICSDSSVWRAHDQNADSNSGHLVFDESSGPGSGFLSELCQQWERASTLMHETGVRTVNVRIKIVLGASGGVLQKLLPLFKLGFGGEMGEWNTVHELGLDR